MNKKLCVIGALIVAAFIVALVSSYCVRGGQVRRIGDENGKLSVVTVFDGGSRMMPFVSADGEVVYLYLDRSCVIVGKTPEGLAIQEPRTDGDLHFGAENFEKKMPLDYDSELAGELYSLLVTERRRRTGHSGAKNEELIQELDMFIEKFDEKRGTTEHSNGKNRL